MTQLMTAKQVMSVLGIGKTTFYKLLNDGALTSVRVGRSRKISQDELEKYIASLPTDIGTF